MANYTPEEIAEFRKKDRRMSLAGIVQALIQSNQFSKEELCDVKSMMDLATKYSNEIWRNANEFKTVDNVVPVGEKTVSREDYWITVAQKNSLKIPTQPECKILESIWFEYLDICPEQEAEKLLPELLMSAILAKYNAYPTKEKSISTVLSSIKLSQLFKDS